LFKIKKKIYNNKVITLSHGNGSGSKLLQSFFDSHKKIILLPGYPLLYFYDAFNIWNLKKISVKLVLNKIFNQFPSIFDSKKYEGSDSLSKLGYKFKYYIKINKKKFSKFFNEFFLYNELNRKNILLAIHYAYARTIKKKIYNDSIILVHTHIPENINKYFYIDFPKSIVFSMTRDPKTNIFSRYENSFLKPLERKIKSSDFIIYRHRVIYWIFDVMLFSLDNIKNFSPKKHFIIKHEDLKYKHKKVFLKICKILNISYSKVLERPTFLNKKWNDKYYQPNNSALVKANFNINEKLKILNFLLEGLLFHQLKKCRYKVYFFKNTILHNIKIFFYILKFNEIEVIEFKKLFSKKNFFKYLNLSLNKDGNIKTNKFYNSNLFYRYKSTIKDLQLYQNNDVKYKNYCKLFISLSNYLMATLSFFYYYIKRIIICYQIFFYGTKNKFSVI
jgi:hypothetical protein